MGKAVLIHTLPASCLFRCVAIELMLRKLNRVLSWALLLNDSQSLKLESPGEDVQCGISAELVSVWRFCLGFCWLFFPPLHNRTIYYYFFFNTRQYLQLFRPPRSHCISSDPAAIYLAFPAIYPAFPETLGTSVNN